MTPRSITILMLVALTACASQDGGAVGGIAKSAEVAVDTEVDVAAPTTNAAQPATTALPTTEAQTIAPPTTAAALPTAAPPAATVEGANPFGGNAPEDFLMPFVVCMNLQQAQDEIQDHGVLFSRSEDATGQGRSQLNDSNWQVVAQYPAEGSPIGETEAVLSVIKYGDEPNPC